VLAATHRDLEASVARGAFRQDLYYRLAIVPIDVPPLRARIEDVEPLARAVLASAARRMAREVPQIAEDDLARLRAWSWPGNVRELENVIERALVLTAGDVLALGETWRPAAESGAAPVLAWDDAQRRILREALDACGGRIYGAGGAAARLGLAPTTLQSKLEKLGMRARR
jgi:DNA-binding NtrC family response regulator